MQGEGGVYPIPEEVGRAITEACRAHGTLLVADEVQTGLGRCGSFFASYRHGLEPDIICVAKGLAGGLPAGAVVWRSELGDFPPHTHGSTYGGNEFVARVSAAALVRGDGLLIGVESEIPSQDIVKALQDNRLLSLPAGPRVVRFLPSFAVTREAAAEGVEIFERTMRELAAKGGKA